MTQLSGMLLVQFNVIFYFSKTYVESCVVLDHINHVREIAGVQSIAIGSDFCGISE